MWTAGTLFTPTTPAALTDAGIRAAILQSYSPPLITAAVLNTTADKLLELYPEDAAEGAPYGTGALTFGLPAGYKRLAALSEWHARNWRAYYSRFKGLCLRDRWRPELRLAAAQLDTSGERCGGEDIRVPLHSAAATEPAPARRFVCS